MNVDKSIKMILLKLNKSGQNYSLIRDTRYSSLHGTMYNKFKLTKWISTEKLDKEGKPIVDENGNAVYKNIPITEEFTNSVELLKRLVVIMNG